MFNFQAHKHRLDGGVYTLRLRSLSCFLTIFAEIWSLNGKLFETASSASLDGAKKATAGHKTFDDRVDKVVGVLQT